MIKNIKKKIILFFLMIFSIFGLNSIISTSKIDKTVNAAGSNINQNINIPGTNTNVRVCYTEDIFISENYSNCITSVPTSGKFYITVIVNTTSSSVQGFEMRWNFGASQVNNVSLFLGNDVSTDYANLLSKTGNQTFAMNMMTGPMVGWAGMAGLYGRTANSQYIEGDASKYYYSTNSMAINTYRLEKNYMLFSLAKPATASADAPAGTYVAFKAYVELNAGVTSFDANCYTMRVTDNGVTIGENRVLNGPTTGLFNASLGGAALSDNVDTTVTATNDSTTKTANLTESNTTANINFDATASTSTTFKVKVDNGKGSIDTSTISSNGISLDSTTPTSDGYSFTCSNTQRGIFSTVSFKVISESKNNSKTYTINVQRMPIITGMTFTSNGGFANPIITTSSSSSTSGVISSFNELPKGTYYVWGSASLQSFNVNYTCDAKSSSYNINNGGNQTGNTFTVNAKSFTISLGYDGSNNATEDYVFNYMTIADNVGLKNVTGTVAGSSTTATVTSTSATEYKATFPYKDANGHVITSANINATLTTPSLSSVEYSFNQSNWTSGSVAPVSFASGNTTTVYFKVKDNSTSATKIYTVNVERTVRDNTDASVTVTNGTSQTGTLNSSTLSLNFTFPATASSSTTIKIKVDAGNGEISNLSSNVTNNGVNNGEYTLVLNSSVRGKYDVVTFDAVAQNGTIKKSYTINIQRLPIITNIQFTKVGSTGVNPILTSGSSSQTDSVVTIPSTGLPKGNYYVWIPTGVTKFNVSFTADALSALFNGSTYNDPVSVASTIINANTFTINLNSSDANKTEVYTFTVKTMVDHTSLKTVSGRVTNASNIGQLSGNASTGFKLTFPYSDSNGKAITSVDVTPTATDPTLSTVYYSTDGGANWTQVPTVGYFPVSINTSTNNASVKIKVEDNSSHNSKEYDVTIERTVSHEVGTVVAISGATPSTATLSATTTSTNFTLPATASSSTTINVTVDSGKGKIDLSTLSGATYSSFSNGTYSLILDPTNRGSFSTVTFTVIAQDGSTSQAYTVNVQRKPIITNITFTKDDGLVDPIITKGSANSSSNPVTNFVDLAEGTYYLWVSPNVAHYLVNYTADCVSSTYNGTAYANTTVQIGTTDLIIVLLSSDSNVKATYKFVYKTITANTGLNDPTTSVTGTSTTGTLDSSTLNSDNGKDYVVKVPYLDSLGNTITSVSVKAPLTTPSSSTLEYYDASTGTWNTITSSTGTPVAIDGTTNQGSIKYRVTDKVTHDFAIYNVTVEREAADTDNSIASVTVYDVTNNNVVRAGTWTGDTYTINSNLPYNSAILRFVVTATSQHAKLTIETQTYGNTASHTHNITTKNQAVKVKITVTPQSGQTAEYYIEYYVADTRSTDRTLNQFEVSDGSNILTPTSGIFTPGTAAPLTLTYDIPYSVNSLTVTANATALGAKVYGAKSTTTSKIVNITMSTFTTSSPSKTYNYYVYSEDEKWSDAYTIVINRLPANGSVGLQNLKVNGQDVYDTNGNAFASQLYTSSQNLEYTLNLGAGSNYGSTATVTANLISGIGNAKLNISQDNKLSSQKKETIVVTATSEDGLVVVKYTITVYTADEDKTIRDFSLLDAVASNIINNVVGSNPQDLKDENGSQVFNYANGDTNVVATINYANREIFFQLLLQSSAARIYYKSGSIWRPVTTQVNNQLTLVEGSNKYSFGIVSELEYLKTGGQNVVPTDVYTFDLTLNTGDTENRLATFAATIGGVPIATNDIIFSPDSDNIIIQNISNYTQTSMIITVNVTKMSAKSSVYFPDDLSKDKLTYTRSLTLASQNTETFSIMCAPEKGSNKTYTVNVIKGSATLDANNDIGNVSISGSKHGQYYNQVPTATNQTNPEIITLDVGDTKTTINVALPAGSKASPKLNVKSPTDSSFQSVSLTNGSYNLDVSTSTTQALEYLLEVYATAENQTDGTKYYIKVIVPITSDNSGLDNITSTDPDVVISDIPGTDNKLIEAKPGTTDVPINVTPADPNATVTITTPNGSNLTFTPNGTDSSQGIVSGLKPGNNEVTITITAPNGDDSTYTTNIWVDENPDLDNIEVYDATDTSKSYGLNPIYQQSTFNYVVNVPYSVNSTILKYAISNTIDTSKLNIRYYLGSSSISNTFNSALEAVINTTNDITVKLVVSQNYSNATPANPLAAGTRTYTIEFKKALPGTDRNLLSISANGDPVPDNGNTPYAPGEYVLEYGRNQSYVDLTNITYNGKSITVTSTDTTLTALTNDNSSYRVMLSAGKAVTVTVMVNAEDATVAPNIYKFVLVAANKDKDVANLELFENNQTYVDINNNSLVFNANTPQYPFTAKNSTNVLTLRITKPQYSTVEIGGVAKNDSYGQTTYDYTIDLSNTVSPNKYTVDVRLLSEYYVAYGQNQADASDAYKIEIERQALDNDATLSKLVVTIDGVAQTIFATRTPEGTFNIPNVGNATSINVEATPTKSTTKINGSSSNPYTNSFTLGGNTSNGYNYQIVLSCVAEDGTPQNYVLEISRGPINASDDNGIILIEVLDSNNAYYIAQQGNAANNVQQFDQTQLPYTITMPYGAKSYTINAQILQGSYAKLYITDGTGSNDVQTASRQFQIASTMYGTTITHKVYAISDSGIKGLEYTITIKFEEPNVDNSLKSLTVDGDEQITSTTPNNPTFTISRPNSVTTVDIAAIVSDPTATIASNSHLGRLSLVEGQNVFNVTVIAQNGDQQTYTIIVNRDYANPTLMDLGVTGEALLDYDTKKVTTFEPNTTKYFVRVPYTKETADIYAYSSSVSDVILGTGTKNLLVGDNKFTVKITSVHGTTTEYELHIYRLPEETMNASLDWLKVFQVGADKSNLMDGSDRLELKDENAKKISDVFNSDKIYYGVYNVNGKVGLLDVKYDTVVHGNEFYDSPVVTVLGADNLHIGKNQVVILVTAPDGIHQKAYVIEVERDDIAYNVLEDQIESDGYTLEKVVDKLEYNINIGKKKTSEVDFLLYIEALNATGDNAEQELEITYKTNIENNPDDVIIEIATKDGITKQVIFHVESTSNHNNADFWTFFPLIILLVIVLIILIMILISVNKDKYGKITRKADKKSDKKEKAANK